MSAARMDRRDFLRLGVAAGLAGAAAPWPARPARAAAADLDFASALDAAGAIRAGVVSSVELTTRMLDRIGRLNPPVNAVVAPWFTVCGVFGAIEPLPVTLGVTVCVSIAKLAITVQSAFTAFVV